MAMAKKSSKPASKSRAPKPVPSGVDSKTLRAASSLWKEVEKPAANSFGDIPDGKYQAVVEQAVIETGGRNRDRLQVKWSFRIQGPTHQNRMCWMNTGLGDATGIEFTKRALGTLGVTIPDEIEDLGDVLSSLAGAKVEVNLKTRTVDQGTFQNTFLNKRLDGDAAVSEGETAVAEEKVSMVGRTVKFDTGEGEIQGKVRSQKGDVLTIDGEDANEWEVGVEEASIVELSNHEEKSVEETPPKGDADLVGRTVSFKDDEGNELKGKVAASDGEGTLTIEVDDAEWEVPEAEVSVVESSMKKAVKKMVRKS